MDTPIAGNQPTHAMIAATADFKDKKTVGKLWLKVGEFGNFLSGELASKREYEGKVFQGYSIVEDNYLQSLVEKIRSLEVQIPKTDFENAIDSAYDKPLEQVDF